MGCIKECSFDFVNPESCADCAGPQTISEFGDATEAICPSALKVAIKARHNIEVETGEVIDLREVSLSRPMFLIVH